MSEKIDCLVVGAGVIGLAIARRLARTGREVLILERETDIGQHTSSRNSEVIHAGFYNRPGSLKARLCVSGRRLLYDYCAEHGIPHRRLGKLVVAAPGQQAALGELHRQGMACGVDDLVLIDGAEARAREPAVDCAAALYSPSTGIIDSHQFMLSLLGDAEAAGASLCRAHLLLGLVPGEPGLRASIAGPGGQTYELIAGEVINAAGLFAWDVARQVKGLAARHIPPRVLARGNYYRLQGANPFHHLVYPLPVAGGLGIHSVPDMGGGLRFGPDVEWCDDIDYRLAEGDGERRRQRAFRQSIARYWPAVAGATLSPDLVGVRPKTGGPGEPAGDFVIAGPVDHGIGGLVNLFGIESPGLTASLAIADEVATVMRRL